MSLMKIRKIILKKQVHHKRFITNARETKNERKSRNLVKCILLYSKYVFSGEIIGFEWSYVPLATAMGTNDRQPLTTQLIYDVRQCVVPYVPTEWPSWRGHGPSPHRV